MRAAPAAFLLLLAAPALAQDPIPDTTAAWRYYPLEIGNVWDYLYRPTIGPVTYSRVSIERDTLIAGERYFVQRTTEYDDDLTIRDSYTSMLRFDTTAANVVYPDDTPLFPCRLDMPFPSFPGGEPIDCGDHAFVEGIGPEVEISIGFPLNTVTVVTAAKQIYQYPGGVLLAANIGFVEVYTCEFCGDSYLLYARVSGMEYGEPLALASEPTTPEARPALSIYPNPTRGVATLTLAVPTPQMLTVEVFDTLGRRVHREGRAASGPTSISLDGRAWAPGVYVVRVTGEGGAQATARLVRQ
jgi:hypothetical protein